MPTYEYECEACGYAFEKFQAMTDMPLVKCPKCSKSLRRLIGSGSAVIFKGRGFYATDYKKSPVKEQKSACASSNNPKCAGCPKNEAQP